MFRKMRRFNQQITDAECKEVLEFRAPGTLIWDTWANPVRIAFLLSCIHLQIFQKVRYEDAKWLDYSELDNVDWLPADQEFLPKLKEWSRNYGE